jgi:hypothetical protein
MNLDHYGPPLVLSQLTGTYPVASDLELAAAMEKWQTWLDEKEIYYIEYYGTSLHGGFNMTRGGQGTGKNTAYFQAALRKSEENWRKTYMPMFRAMEEYHKKCLWKIPRSHKLGKILHSVRAGNSSIPYTFIFLMKEAGFDQNRSVHESRWIDEYLPAFRDSLYGKENRLWQMSIKCVVNGVPLGRIVNHIRVGHTSVPAAHLPELERMGFQDGRSYFDCYFEFINMPALRACVYGQEKRLSETPAAYVTDDGMQLGQLLRRIKRGRSSIPNACREEMTLRGFSGPVPSSKKTKT